VADADRTPSAATKADLGDSVVGYEGRGGVSVVRGTHGCEARMPAGAQRRHGPRHKADGAADVPDDGDLHDALGPKQGRG
jgi:hypothetical protein